MGAWIETPYTDELSVDVAVAPHVGAWIETLLSLLVFWRPSSHPTWVRGLKLVVQERLVKLHQSHPTWVRGLKQNPDEQQPQQVLSHPTWVRGLKLRMHLPCHHPADVAPHVGAWIETGARPEPGRDPAVAPHVGAWIETGRVLGRRVVDFVAPHVGAWIETLHSPCQAKGFRCRTPRGCVD